MSPAPATASEAIVQRNDQWARRVALLARFELSETCNVIKVDSAGKRCAVNRYANLVAQSVWLGMFARHVYSNLESLAQE
jgi:hypothetical protein